MLINGSIPESEQSETRHDRLWPPLPDSHPMAGRRRTDHADEGIEIDTRYAAERWRYICPMGHIDWRVTEEGFVCPACEQTREDGRFSALLERRSRERIPRERIRVVETAVAAAYETGGGEADSTPGGDSSQVGSLPR